MLSVAACAAGVGAGVFVSRASADDGSPVRAGAASPYVDSLGMPVDGGVVIGVRDGSFVSVGCGAWKWQDPDGE